MSLLAPLFLLGMLAIAAPVLAHLVRRATRERVRFSATEFLDPSPPAISKRRKLEHPWLLLLRALVVAILAFAFARPFFDKPSPIAPASDPPRHVVVVLDQSASMQRGSRFADAIERVRAVAASLRTDDRIAIVGTASARPLLSADAWRGASGGEARRTLLASTLEDLEPGWGPTRLDSAIDTAIEEAGAMNEAAGGSSPAEIVVVSDFTAGARLSGLAGREWPRGVHLTLSELPALKSANVALHALGWTQLPDGQRAARLRIFNDSPDSRQVQLALNDAATGDLVEPATSQVLAPGERRVVRIEIPDTAPRALGAGIGDDEDAFDNNVWLVPPQSRQVGVVYLGNAEPGDAKHARYYVSRAMQPARGLAPSITAIDPNASALPEAALYVVADAPSPELERALRDRLQQGAFALLLASGTELVESAGRLAGEEKWSSHDYARPDALLGEIDFTHPQFEVFADPRFSDFTHVRFWEPVALQLPENSGAQVIARFEEGSPALVEAAIGSGTLLVWGGGWTPEAGQWVLSSKFVPWVQTLLLRASGGAPGAASAEVGDIARLSLAPEAAWERIQTPGTSSSSAGIPAAPGVYRVLDEGRERLVALQTPAAESDNEALPLETWEELGVPLAAEEPRAAAARSAPGLARSADLESEQKLWRWFLLAAIAVLAAESLVSIRLAHRNFRSA
ncbi:MAG: BatA domain-containing protein [Opitutaceae bacterium]